MFPFWLSHKMISHYIMLNCNGKQALTNLCNELMEINFTPYYSGTTVNLIVSKKCLCGSKKQQRKVPKGI